MSFADNLYQGKVGEGLIAKWLKSRGFNVLPVYQLEIHEGKGPQLFTAEGAELVAPDMIAFKGNMIRWVEAKHKSVFSWHRKSSCWVTGIDLHHYDHYCDIADFSPFPVFLMFLHRCGYTDEPPHDCPTGLFFDDIQILRHRENHRHANWGKTGMVYWNKDAFRYHYDLPEVIKLELSI